MNATAERILAAVGLPPPGVQDLPDGRVVLLTGIRPTNPSAPRGEQTRQVLEQMEALLKPHGCDFSHVARTWFYLDRILDWYGAFNAARTTFFRERKVFAGVVPASTGIGLKGLGGDALLGAVLAVRPAVPAARVRLVRSPMQCEALDYESSFSRAVEFTIAGEHRIYVSGTASIDEGGASVHPSDFEAQVRLSLAVVEQILNSRGFDWPDVTRSIAYVRDEADLPRVGLLYASFGLAQVPVSVVHADICRRELMFEIEVDAVRRAG